MKHRKVCPFLLFHCRQLIFPDQKCGRHQWCLRTSQPGRIKCFRKQYVKILVIILDHGRFHIMTLWQTFVSPWRTNFREMFDILWRRRKAKPDFDFFSKTAGKTQSKLDHGAEGLCSFAVRLQVCEAQQKREWNCGTSCREQWSKQQTKHEKKTHQQHQNQPTTPRTLQQ